MVETRLKQHQGPAYFTPEQDQLELNGYLLKVDDWLELCILGHWVPGRVDMDASGWYLLTPDQAGIRLRDGLRARLLSEPPICVLPSHPPRQCMHVA